MDCILLRLVEYSNINIFLLSPQESGNLLAETLPPELHYAIPEVTQVYLNESVGNSTRIDYESGHEMAFIMFLYFLFQIVFLNLNDFCVIGSIVRER